MEEKKNQKKDACDFSEALLKKNHFQLIKNNDHLNNPFKLFAQLLDKDYSKYEKGIQYICIKKLENFYKKKKFPYFIKFLQEQENFLEYYCKNQNDQFLLAFNFYLIAHCFQITIELLFLNECNQNFFSSQINPAKEFTVFIFTEIINQKDLKISMIEKTNLDQIQTEIKEQYFKSIYNKLDRFIESDQFKIICQENQKKQTKAPILRKKSTLKKAIKPLKLKIDHDVDYQKYELLFKENFSPIYQIQMEFFNYKNQETTWTSAKKQMRSVFEKYTKSVNKNSVIDQSQFSFKDKQEDQQKSESEDFSKFLQYTDYPPNVFLDTKPPGNLKRTSNLNVLKKHKNIQLRKEKRFKKLTKLATKTKVFW